MKGAIWIYFVMLLCFSNRLTQPWDCNDARNYTVRSLSYDQILFFGIHIMTEKIQFKEAPRMTWLVRWLSVKDV